MPNLSVFFFFSYLPYNNKVSRALSQAIVYYSFKGSRSSSALVTKNQEHSATSSHSQFYSELCFPWEVGPITGPPPWEKLHNLSHDLSTPDSLVHTALGIKVHTLELKWDFLCCRDLFVTGSFVRLHQCCSVCNVSLITTVLGCI